MFTAGRPETVKSPRENDKHGNECRSRLWDVLRHIPFILHERPFWEDFTIADRFGLSAIRDTYNRAFKEWNENYKFLTELVLVLNHKIWQHHKSHPEVAALYNDLWKQADLYAVENLKDDELNYFFEVTD